jgi:hypothetical protein
MAAANFLWNPGTTNNGLTATAFTLLNTELNAIATLTGFAVSSGSFSNSNSAQAVWAELFLTLGTMSTLVAGANFCGWFAQSYDGGTTFEQTASLPPPRPPDFIVPLPVASITAGTVWKASGLVLLPALKYKVVCQNNSGQTTAGSAANFLRAAPVNMQSL